MRTTLFLAGIAPLVLCHTGAFAQEEKLPVPDPASRKAVLKEIKDLFKQDYARRDTESLRALASKLLTQAVRSRDDAPSCFVFLTEARTLAAKAGDVTTAFEAIEKLSEFFDLSKGKKGSSPLEMKLDVLKTAQRRIRAAEELRPIADGYLDVSREALATGDFDSAQSAVKSAASLARKSRDKALTSETSELSKEIPELKREFEAASKLDLSKAIDVGDHRNNLNMGRFLCFVKADWEKGATFLQWSGNKSLSEVAKKELATPDDSGAQFELGEGWYSIGKKERSSLHKNRYYGRACYWYGKALGNADGLTAVAIEKRLETLEPFVQSGINLLRLIDPKRDTVLGEWVVDGGTLACTTPVSDARLQIPYIPPAQYNLTFTFNCSGRHHLSIGLAGPESQFGVTLDNFPQVGWLSGLELIDGKRIDANETKVEGQLLTKKGPVTVLCQVRRRNVRVMLDGKMIINWTGDLKRLSVVGFNTVPNDRALFVSAWASKVTVTKLLLTPLSGQGKALR